MKVVILAGGLGSRLAEETDVRPKPMVEIGGKPILWHIMQIYSHYGLHDFVVCLGYKGYVVKEYFANYFLHMSDVTFDLRSNKMQVHRSTTEPWTVTLVDTGAHTMTGGRLKRVQDHLNDETFCLTYGDGVADVDVASLIAFHKENAVDVTLTAIQPQARFGVVETDGVKVRGFKEKPRGEGGWVNGGFFVVEPSALSLVEDDSTIWEQAPLEQLASEGRLAAYKHHGFWQAMDTIRDKALLEQLWQSGAAPWKIW